MQQKYIHWFSTVTPVFVRYNSSVLTSTETLPIYFQTFGIQIFGKVSLKKSEFCSLCGNDIVLDIPSKEEKIGIPKKSKPKRTQNPTQKERKRNPPRVLPDTTGK